ncbi:hypothetical protein X777_02618 [Ooceraea biroi]|uniref:Uncharacterized protein n=1 Tax=Ooceraea biroi TaxID=2015173 RepID=A0A026WMR5_OOCBI|nr:hypothetical protein X777_02618 [Ooceraea biroi]
MHCRGPALGTAWHSFDEPATCNLRKVQVSGKRLMRATREYEPLFHAIKQFPRTHGIMGRAGGNGNFVDKIVVAVRTYVRTYETIRYRHRSITARARARFLESTLISLQPERLFILDALVSLTIRNHEWTRAVLLGKRCEITVPFRNTRPFGISSRHNAKIHRTFSEL